MSSMENRPHSPISLHPSLLPPDLENVPIVQGRPQRNINPMLLAPSLENMSEIEELPQGKLSPMLLGPVLQRVYKFLSLEDIKQCRLVHSEWYANSHLVIRKRSKIVICKKKGQRGDEILAKFYEDFSTTASIPFTAFKFDGTSIYFLGNELNFFFDAHQKYLRELELINIILYCQPNFCIDSWISKTPMILPNTNYNTKLAIESERHYCHLTCLTVTMSAITHIKNLSFEGNAIYGFTNARQKLQPIDLKLHYVYLYSDNPIVLNNVINFSKSKNVSLRGTHMILDYSDIQQRANFDSLSIEHVEICYRNSSTWSANKLQIGEFPDDLGRSIFTMITIAVIAIKELDISCEELPHLLIVPDTIEKLSIRNIDVETLQPGPGRDPFYPPNLKVVNLQITDPVRARAVVSDFLHCPKLVDIHFTGHSKLPLEVKLSWIPKSVKRIQITRLSVVWEEEEDEFLFLEQLVLYEHTADQVMKMINHVYAENVILYHLHKISFYELVDLFEYLVDSETGQRIFAGPEFDSIYDILNYNYGISHLQKIHDEKSKCCVFNTRAQLLKILPQIMQIGT